MILVEALNEHLKKTCRGVAELSTTATDCFKRMEEDARKFAEAFVSIDSLLNKVKCI